MNTQTVLTFSDIVVYNERVISTRSKKKNTPKVHYSTVYSVEHLRIVRNRDADPYSEFLT